MHAFVCADCDQDTLNLALVQYQFTQGEHEVKVAPHGNSQSAGGYMRTMPSVMSKLRAASSQRTPKRAIEFSHDQQGGILGASSAGLLPRSRQQVKDMRRKTQHDDPLFSVMYMCKSEEGRGKNPFVRLVNAAPFPMMVLAYDATLYDLHRFCTGPSKFCILGVDPTFSLGDFDVTVTTYQHLMLSSQQTSKYPVFIGPMFVHVKKDFPAYHFFTSALIGLQPSLVDLRAFGTDGEAALVNAFSVSFPKACHLRCFLHFKGNIEQKLKELKVPSDVARKFVEDIMGKPSHFILGLVDANDPAHLDELLNKLEGVWNEREEPFNSPPVFFSWFNKYERDVIANSMTRETRIKAGLGNPPRPYYTNEVESKNNILKQHVHYKSSELPTFVDSMKELLIAQQKEIEKSIVGQGEYRIRSEYKMYAVDQTKWYTFSEAQRHKCVEKFMKADNPPTKGSLCGLSDASNPLSQLPLPPHFVKDVWAKAERLVKGDNLLVRCPGESMSWMVQSEKTDSPHFVKPAKKVGGFLCDGQCLGYKCSKVCSHTVAVALKTGNIDAFVKWFHGMKRPAMEFNVTALADVDRPAGTGRKRKGISKKGSTHLQSLCSSMPDSAWTYGSGVGDSGSSSESGAVTVHPPSAPETSRSAVAVATCQPETSPSPAEVHCSALAAAASSGQTPHVTHPKANISDGAHQNCSSIPGTIQVSNSTVQIGAYRPSSVSRAPREGEPALNQVVIQQSRPAVESPFWVAFLFGNVSRCNGCKGKIQRLDGKPLPPPDDLVLGHKEFVVFINPKSSRFEQSWDKRNVYYHPRKVCIAPNFLDFDPRQHIRVGSDVRARLQPEHIRYLQTEFNIAI